MLFAIKKAVACSIICSCSLLPVPNASTTPTFDVLASKETYGHAGWTGTLTAIDPVNHMAIVILGNRPHSPVADPTKNPNVFVSG